MGTNNPAFKKDIFNLGHNAPGSPGEVMTYNGTINKTALGFIVLLIAGALGWAIPALMMIGLVGTLVITLVMLFKKSSIGPGLYLTYSGLQGLLIGGISNILEAQYSGIVMQAVLATLSVFAVILMGSKMKIFKTSPKLNKIVGVAIIGYGLFSLLNLGLMLFGVTSGMWGLYSDLGPLGIGITVVAVLLASYTLLQDIEYIQNGVENRAPANTEWLAAFGLVSTLIWMYVEILRLISLFRN